MADTQRDLAALQTLFANNATGAIGAQQLRDFLVSTFGGYGGLYSTGASVQTVNIAAALLTAWTAAFPASGTTPDAGALKQVAVTVAGTYAVEVQATATATAGRTVTLELRKNGVLVTGTRVSQKFAAAGDVESVSLFAIVTLAAGDLLTVYASADVDATSYTVQQGQFTVRRVG